MTYLESHVPFTGFLHIENIVARADPLGEAVYIFWVKEVFCTFSVSYTHLTLPTTTRV